MHFLPVHLEPLDVTFVDSISYALLTALVNLFLLKTKVYFVKKITGSAPKVFFLPKNVSFKCDVFKRNFCLPCNNLFATTLFPCQTE